MQHPEASFVPFLRWALAGSLPSWQRVGWWGIAHKAFSGPIRLLPEVEDLWSWFPCLAMPFKAQVHTEQEEAQSSLFLWRAKCRGETRMRYFPEPTRIGAELGFRRSVSLSRMQLLEAIFVPFLRWALPGSLPNLQRVVCWGQCTKGLFRPHPPSPQRRARLGLVSSSSDDLQSTGAQGARGSTDPLWP